MVLLYVFSINSTMIGSRPTTACGDLILLTCTKRYNLNVVSVIALLPLRLKLANPLIKTSFVVQNSTNFL